MRQLTVYDGIRTHARLVLRWQVREAMADARFEPPDDLDDLPRPVRQRELLRLATEAKLRQYASARLRELVRAVVLELEADRLLRKAGLRVIQGGR